MLARCRSVAVFGIEAYEVEVEVDVRGGLPDVTFVGLPDAAVRELEDVVASGQQVIDCQYGPTDPATNTGYQGYGFWYEDVPDNIDELLSVARDGGAPMPVFHLGSNAISACPESMGEAESAWRAGR